MGPDMASLGTSLFAVHSILGALYHRWRMGEGQHIGVSMLGSMIFQRGFTWTSMVGPDEWAGHSTNYLKPPHHGYKTADQPIVLGPVRPEDKFPALLRALGMEEYLEHDLFQNPPAAIMGVSGGAQTTFDAKPIWEKVFSTWKAEDLLAVLNKFGSDSNLVNSYKDLFAHPQMDALGMVGQMNDPKLGRVKVLLPPWKLRGLPTVDPRPYKPLASS